MSRPEGGVRTAERTSPGREPRSSRESAARSRARFCLAGGWRSPGRRRDSSRSADVGDDDRAKVPGARAGGQRLKEQREAHVEAGPTLSGSVRTVTGQGWASRRLSPRRAGAPNPLTHGSPISTLRSYEAAVVRKLQTLAHLEPRAGLEHVLCRAVRHAQAIRHRGLGGTAGRGRR
jgi:hypothetical protein